MTARSTDGIRVESVHHEVMTFSVESWSSPQRPHRVDLLANGGFGECSCTDWSTRRGPAIKAGGAPGTAATTCRHVSAARRFFLNNLLRQMAADHGQ